MRTNKNFSLLSSNTFFSKIKTGLYKSLPILPNTFGHLRFVLKYLKSIGLSLKKKKKWSGRSTVCCFAEAQIWIIWLKTSKRKDTFLVTGPHWVSKIHTSIQLSFSLLFLQWHFARGGLWVSHISGFTGISLLKVNNLL